MGMLAAMLPMLMSSVLGNGQPSSSGPNGGTPPPPQPGPVPQLDLGQFAPKRREPMGLDPSMGYHAGGAPSAAPGITGAVPPSPMAPIAPGPFMGHRDMPMPALTPQEPDPMLAKKRKIGALDGITA